MELTASVDNPTQRAQSTPDERNGKPGYSLLGRRRREAVTGDVGASGGVAPFKLQQASDSDNFERDSMSKTCAY